MDGVLVRFGEIGIKSAPVRRRMLDRLRQNLLDGLLRAGVEGGVERRGARLWMTGPDAGALATVATRTFGVVSASVARRVPATMESMGQAAADLALASAWSSFAVRASREGEHAFSSQDIGRRVGAAVWAAAEAAGRVPRVDLDDPQMEVFVEVRGDVAFVHAGKLPGPGGLPVGTQGRVVAVLTDRASQLAAWLMMRRGCAVTGLGRGSFPLLQRWGLGSVDLTATTDRAALLEEAVALARRVRAQAVVTGDTLDDAPLAAALPVLRPLCGLDPAEAARWRAVMEAT